MDGGSDQSCMVASQVIDYPHRVMTSLVVYLMGGYGLGLLGHTGCISRETVCECISDLGPQIVQVTRSRSSCSGDNRFERLIPHPIISQVHCFALFCFCFTLSLAMQNGSSKIEKAYVNSRTLNVFYNKTRRGRFCSTCMLVMWENSIKKQVKLCSGSTPR